MAQKIKNEYYFYSNGQLAVIHAASESTSIFRERGTILAGTCNRATTCFATTNDRSITGSMKSGGVALFPYTAYGHVNPEVLSPILLGYKGERNFLSLGYLLGNGYRAYSPLLMRFLSPDSASPFYKGGPNSYAYVGCDPINGTDPTGHWLEWISPSLKLPRTTVSTKSSQTQGKLYVKSNKPRAGVAITAERDEPRYIPAKPFDVMPDGSLIGSDQPPLDDVIQTAVQTPHPLASNASPGEIAEYKNLRLALIASRTDQVIGNLELRRAMQGFFSLTVVRNLIRDIEISRRHEYFMSQRLSYLHKKVDSRGA